MSRSSPAARIAKRIEEGKKFDEKAAAERGSSMALMTYREKWNPGDLVALQSNSFVDGARLQHAQSLKALDALKVAMAYIESDACDGIRAETADGFTKVHSDVCERCACESRIADILEGKK